MTDNLVNQPAGTAAVGVQRPRPVALVVDDSATVRAYHRNILVAAGFRVAESVNGYEALEAIMVEHFDLLLVDVNMPVLDGYALVEAVRTGSYCAEVPIIMVSSEQESGDLDEAYRRGANVYLVKPADPKQLEQTARMLCALVGPPDSGDSASGDSDE